MLFEELAELTGQRNAIDGRIVQIVAEMEHDQLAGMTGARSIPALVAWKTGSSSTNAKAIAAIAHRFDEFPRCTAGMREGRLSLDQVGEIAKKAGRGSDEHYAELASVATVSQLSTALKLEPRPEPDPKPQPVQQLGCITPNELRHHELRLSRLVSSGSKLVRSSWAVQFGG